MKYDWRKHKNYAHAILGVLIALFWFIMLPKYAWQGVVIMGGVSAGVTEYVQQWLKMGTNSWKGLLKTWVPSLLYGVYKIIEYIF